MSINTRLLGAFGAIAAILIALVAMARISHGKQVSDAAVRCDRYSREAGPASHAKASGDDATWQEF